MDTICHEITRRHIFIYNCDCIKAEWHKNYLKNISAMHKDESSIRICTWNILNCSYANNFPYYLFSHALEPERLNHIWSNICSIQSTDILLLQEDSFENDLKQQLSISMDKECTAKYSPMFNLVGYQKKKFNLKTNDCISLYYNSDRFEEIEYKAFSYSEIMERDSKLMTNIKKYWSKSMYERFKRISCVFQVIALYDSISKNYYIVSNTHNFSNNKADIVRLLHTVVLCNYLDSFSGEFSKSQNIDKRSIKLVLAGDYNAKLVSASTRFLCGDDIEMTDPIYDTIGEFIMDFDIRLCRSVKYIDQYLLLNTSFCTFKNPLRLKKAEFDGLKWTNNTGEFIEVLDYIFITNNITIKNAVQMSDMSEVNTFDETQHKRNEEEIYGIPTKSFGSDHIPLICDIS